MHFFIVLILCKCGPSAVPLSTYLYISYFKPIILTVLSLASQCAVIWNIVWNVAF